MTHIPGSAPGPADQPNGTQPDPAWSQPADQGPADQGPPAAPPAGNYPDAEPPGTGQQSPGQPYAGEPYADQHGPGQPGGATGATSIGLEPPIAGLLAYAFGWISGLIILLTEKQHQPVRFHAAQSIAVFGSLTVLGTVTSVLSFIPVIGWILALAWILIGPLAVFLWIFMMIRAYNQVETRLPVAAGIADKIMGSFR